MYVETKTCYGSFTNAAILRWGLKDANDETLNSYILGSPSFHWLKGLSKTTCSMIYGDLIICKSLPIHSPEHICTVIENFKTQFLDFLKLHVFLTYCICSTLHSCAPSCLFIPCISHDGAKMKLWTLNFEVTCTRRFRLVGWLTSDFNTSLVLAGHCVLHDVYSRGNFIVACRQQRSSCTHRTTGRGVGSWCPSDRSCKPGWQTV